MTADMGFPPPLFGGSSPATPPLGSSNALWELAGDSIATLQSHNVQHVEFCFTEMGDS